MVEKEPRLVEDQQRRFSVELLIEPVEEIGQHRQHGARLVHQFFHLEALDGTERQSILVGIEQTSKGTFERVGLQGLA